MAGAADLADVGNDDEKCRLYCVGGDAVQIPAGSQAGDKFFSSGQGEAQFNIFTNRIFKQCAETSIEDVTIFSC
jgi:hypothetical protein